MNNNAGHLTRLTVIFSCLLSLAHSALYPYGTDHGDSLLVDNFVEFSIDPIRFLGTGEISGLWVNEGGSLTHKELLQDTLDKLTDNVALCPLFEKPALDTEVFYRQVMATEDTAGLFDTITQDIRTSDLLPEIPNSKALQDNYVPIWALVVTWKNTLSTGESNHFQLTITSNGRESFAIYNYQDTLTLWGDQGQYPFAGLYAAGDDKSSCYVSLEGSQNENIVQINTKSNVKDKSGRFVMIISEPFLCQTNYTTPCGELSDESSRWGSTEVYFENIKDGEEDYVMYALFTCDEGFHISDGVRTQKIACNYDSDYYDSNWDLGSAQKCIDLEATRQFDVRALVTEINGEQFIWDEELKDPTSEIFIQMEEIVKDSFKGVLEDAGVVDVSISIASIKNRTLGGRSLAQIEFDVKIPPYIQKKLNSTKLQEKIEEALKDENTTKSVEYYQYSEVVENTKECLTACLCRNQPDRRLECPKNSTRQIQTNMCCGGCNGVALGNAYASEIKGCCGHVIFDPTKAICCNGKIKRKTEENNRACNRRRRSS